MKLTMLEVMDAHRGLPALVDRFLQFEKMDRALVVAGYIHKLQVHVEVFQITQTALLNAHGQMDKDTRQKVVLAGTEGFEKYRDAQRELLESVLEVGVELIRVTAADLQGLDHNAFIAMSPLLEFAKEE